MFTFNDWAEFGKDVILILLASATLLGLLGGLLFIGSVISL